MKTTTVLFGIAALALTTTACSSDEQQDPSIIRIGTNLEAAIDAGTTRAASNLQETTLDATGAQAKPGVYVWKAGSTSAQTVAEVSYGYENVVATSVDGSSGALSTSAMYFPVDRSDVDVYVYAPGVSTGASWSAMPIAVLTDQSDKDGYLKSDFLWGKAANVAYGTAASVTMSHRLSKVIIKVSKDAANGSPSLANLNSVTLGTDDAKVKLDATVNMANGTVTPGSTEGIVTFAKDLTGLTESSNDLEYAAILPPGQNLDGQKVTLNFGGSVNYVGTLSTAQLNLTSANKYTINVLVGVKSVTVSSINITGWTGSNAASVSVN